MAQSAAWWLQKESLQPRGSPLASVHAPIRGRPLDAPNVPKPVSDEAGYEIFLGSRRGRSQYVAKEDKPAFYREVAPAPFGTSGSMLTSPRPSPLAFNSIASDESGWLSQRHRSKYEEDGTSYYNGLWRKGDELPLALDGTPRKPREAPDPRLRSDPDISGGGYRRDMNNALMHASTAEMIFGPQAASPRGSNASQSDLELQIAQWRLGKTDDSPFSLDPSKQLENHPRVDPRRKADHELLAFTNPESADYEGARREMTRRDPNRGLSEDSVAAAANPIHAKMGTQWREGDPNPFVFNGLDVLPPPARDPHVDTTWRGQDSQPFSLSGVPAPPRQRPEKTEGIYPVHETQAQRNAALEEHRAAAVARLGRAPVLPERYVVNRPANAGWTTDKLDNKLLPSLLTTGGMHGGGGGGFQFG